MLPATVTCSYAFMLPVATPPIAIVFAEAKMKAIEMLYDNCFYTKFNNIVVLHNRYYIYR